MNKRLILAIALSFFVMLIWSRLTQRFYPIDTQEVITEQTETELAPVVPALDIEQTTENQVSVISQDREFIFDLPSACLKKVIFQNFGDYVFDLGYGICLTRQDLVFRQQQLTSQEAVFIAENSNLKITKQLDYSNPDFLLILNIKIENLSDQSIAYPADLILGLIDISSSGLDARFKEVFVKQPEGILRLPPSKETKVKHSGEFFGFRDRYFCAIIKPMTFPETLAVSRLGRKQSQLVLSRPEINLAPGQIEQAQYEIYIGPQKIEPLGLFTDGADKIVYYGFFDPISKMLLRALRFFARLVHNWGFAIVILSVAIFFLLFPLSLKQMRSTKEMQYLQPHIEELRKLHKDNPQKLNKEVLELYKTHKVNPLGGCLPLLLQIPIFISLYQGLMRSIELKGANFLWIQDLSQPDRLITSPEINLLPILMAITMFLQQRSSMTSMSGSSGEQQRLMSFIFPIMFGFIFYRMPSGLVLYWFLNSTLMFIYQTRIKVANEPVQH